MPFSSDFADVLKDEVSLAHLASRDDYNVPSYGTPSTGLKCRIVHKNTLIRDRNGSDVVSTSQIWLDYDADTTVESQITMPDGSNPPILSVEKYPDESGNYFMKIFLSQWPR